MIRKWDTEDTAPLLALWLDSTIHAHPFISESYWRDSVAVAVDRPKFTVLSDQMLAEIAETRPVDERALVRVKGVGPTKINQYGAAILGIVARSGAARS